MYFSGVLYAIKNGIEHIKKYNLWHRAQILIFNGTEHMSYNFSWHTRNFLQALPRLGMRPNPQGTGLGGINTSP
jgi:hypothetical protein